MFPCRKRRKTAWAERVSRRMRHHIRRSGARSQRSSANVLLVRKRHDCTVGLSRAMPEKKEIILQSRRPERERKRVTFSLPRGKAWRQRRPGQQEANTHRNCIQAHIRLALWDTKQGDLKEERAPSQGGKKQKPKASLCPKGALERGEERVAKGAGGRGNRWSLVALFRRYVVQLCIPGYFAGLKIKCSVRPCQFKACKRTSYSRRERVYTLQLLNGDCV